jgi:hypothetical protein
VSFDVVIVIVVFARQRFGRAGLFLKREERGYGDWLHVSIMRVS